VCKAGVARGGGVKSCSGPTISGFVANDTDMRFDFLKECVLSQSCSVHDKVSDSKKQGSMLILKKGVWKPESLLDEVDASEAVREDGQAGGDG
jgi:hypothetical protein